MIVEWLGSINAIIDSKGRVDEKYKGMGTTLVALAYYEGHFYSMNCGDSRLYRFCDGRLTQLTTDHTFKDVLDTGKRTSVITNCIGGGTRNSYVDMVQMTKDVQPGDIYLLCSDGLTDMLSDQEIETMLKAGADADMLCQAAIQAGGFDNVSVCTIEVKSKITT
jgi:protein phosphatase